MKDSRTIQDILSFNKILPRTLIKSQDSSHHEDSLVGRDPQAKTTYKAHTHPKVLKRSKLKQSKGRKKI